MEAIEMSRRVIVSPGPVDISPEALAEIEPLHHRSIEFAAVVRESAAIVREALSTEHPVYFITASGTGAMEAAVANATAPGGRFLVISCGKFGDRWAEIAAAYQCDLSVMRLADGEAIPLEAVIDRVRRERPAYLALTHVESSTGALFPVRELVAGLEGPRPVIMVDAVSSFGAEELSMDKWGIDVVVGASQKGLAAPAGLGFIALDDRARAGATRRGLYYFDLERYVSTSGESAAPFTPAVRTMQIVHRSLTSMRRTGFGVVRSRHRRASSAFLSACRSLGMAAFPETPSSAVQALRLPKKVSDTILLDALSRRGFVAAGGQGKLRGLILRTGFLGLHDGPTLERLVRAVGEGLLEAGAIVDIPRAEKLIAEYDEPRRIP